MLHVHRSERADALVEPLAAVLAAPLEDPFAVDVVAVPTRGVERWLAQRLSHHLGAGALDGAGVCAAVDFASPAHLLAAAVAAALGGAHGPAGAEDPWRVDRLTWDVLATLDACAGEPWCAALGRHLGADAPEDDPRRGRRYAVARHLAGLFTAYAGSRPSVLRGWAEGRDEDGAGGAVPADLAWQPELWRRVRDRVGVPSPAERLPAALAAIEAGAGAVPLPPRVSVFGPTRLPEDQLAVLGALARHRDVHLWLPHPSPGLWARVAAAGRTPDRRRRGSPAAHPFLASMGRDVVEMQQRLPASGDAVHTLHRAPETPSTLLGALQRRLRADSPDLDPHPVRAGDTTVQVHACHGPARQVEVLREVLTGLLADDATLEPRDVLVMCPDVEAVAPLVAAAFGGERAPGPSHPGRGLSVSVADASQRRVNPVLAVLVRLLDLAGGRVTGSEVLDLARCEPVRRRFRLGDDELARLAAWVRAAGVRWGENRARRARFGLRDIGQGTWEAGLDRVLLGVAMAEEDERYLGPALPLDDVGGTEVDLAGRLAELLDRVSWVLDRLTGSHPLEHWLATLEGGLDRLVAVEADQGWTVAQAREVLAEARSSAPARAAAPVRLPDVTALLAHRLAGRPTRAGFRTGAVTLCGLEPMRAVPHRVICLLGIEDGSFPRTGAVDGDDLLLRDPLVGEHDRRSEDRQVFLDAVTAAADALIVIYSGADERTGSPRPPAVPVAELLDALDAAARVPADGGGAGRRVREIVVRHHPLLDVAERNFLPGALGRPGPFSFDRAALAAARVARGPRSDPGPFLPNPLPPDGEVTGQAVDLEDVVVALEHPARAFVRLRLGATLPGDSAIVDDHLPLALDPLQRWTIGDRLLAAFVGGVDPRRALEAEWRRGEVPPRLLGRAALTDIEARALVVADAVRAAAAGEPDSVDVTVAVPGGPLLRGTVAGVHRGTLIDAVYSTLGPKHRLRAWVRLLALAAAVPDESWTAVTVGRHEGPRPRARVSTLSAPPARDAATLLAALVAVHAAALTEPLPLPLAPACAYARSRHAGHGVEAALDDAARQWQGFSGPGDAYHRLVWGDGAAFRGVVAQPPDRASGVWPGESTRFGALARTVWDALLAHESTAVA